MDTTGKPSEPDGSPNTEARSSSASPKLSGVGTGSESVAGASGTTIGEANTPTSRELYGPNETRRIYKNLVGLGLSFMLLFSAYMATVNLQSSINGNLGMYSLAIVFGTTVVVALFLPPLALNILKVKVTLIVSVVGFSAYELCQFHTSYYTFIPAALILGVCGALIWAAVQTYMAKIAEEYAFLTKQTTAAVLQHFFGIFFLLFHFSQIWGNLVSSAVLSTAPPPHGGSAGPANSSNNAESILKTCGPNFGPQVEDKTVNQPDHNATHNKSGVAPPIVDNLTRPPDAQIFLLFGIFFGFTIMAGVIIAFLVDSLTRYGETELKNKPKPTLTGLLIATIKHLKKPKQLLIIPVTVWLGVQEGLLGADFTIAYVGCAWGLQYIGYVMMCFGVCAALGSGIVGKLMALFGRTTLFIVAAILDLACLVIMRVWEPHPDQLWLFFVVAALWGLGDGVWSPQVKALYADLFPDTAAAASSNTILWTSVGFIIVFVLQGAFFMITKLYIYIILLVFSMACYVVIEILERRKKKQEAADENQTVELQPGPEFVDLTSETGGTGVSETATAEERVT